MKKIKLTVLLASMISINGISQNTWSYEYKSAFSEQVAGLIQYGNEYIVYGVQGKRCTIQQEYTLFRSFYSVVSQEGNSINTIIPDTFGTNTIIRAMFEKNNMLYTIGLTNYGVDTSKLIIEVRDTNLNLLMNKTYNNIKGPDIYVSNQCLIIDDTMITGIGSIYNYNVGEGRKPFFFKIKLPTLELLQVDTILEKFYPSALHFDKSNKHYHVFTSFFNSYYQHNVIATYDSSMLLIKTDTLKNMMSSNTNYLNIYNSYFLISGKAVYPQNGYFYPQICCQVYDLNYQSISSLNCFYIDSSDVFPGTNTHLVQNATGNYFLGGQLSPLMFSSRTDFGMLVIKIDSSLNKLWQREIPGNNTDVMRQIHPTNDGGVLILSSYKEDSIPGINKYNARLIKLGPNGEITSVVSLSNTQGERIKLYPNPAKDILNLEYGSFGDLQSLEIYNLQGQRILHKTGKDLHSINISSLSSGTYLLKATCRKGKVMTEKFVKR